MPVEIKTLYRSNKKKTWLAATVLFYAFLGFVIAPMVIKKVAVNTVSEQFNSSLSIEKVRLNPFALSLKITGLDLLDHQEESLFSVGEIYVNFQLSSLFNRAWTFRDFLVSNPELHIDRYEDGSFNFDYLLEIMNSEAEPEAEQEETDSSLPGLLVHQFAITDAVFHWEDEVPVTDVDHRFGPIHLEFDGLSTLPDRAADHEVVITTETQGTLIWDGNVSLNPLSSSGHVSVSNSDFPLISRYIRDDTGINVTEGHISIDFDYDFSVLPTDSEQTLQASADNLNVTFSDIAAEVYASATADADDSDREFVRIPTLALVQGSMQWPEQRIDVEEIQLDGTSISLLRDSNGIVNLQKIPLMTGAGEEQEAPSAAEENSGPGWNVSLGAFTITGLSAELADESVSPQTTVGIDGLDFSLLDISNQADDVFAASLTTGFLHEGQLTLSGNVTVLPEPVFELDLAISDFGLGVAEPYIQTLARLGLDGRFGVQGRLEKQPDELFSFTGDLSVADFLLTENIEDSRLSSWDRLQVNNLAYSLSGNSLEVSELTLEGLYGDIVIDEQGRLNAALVSQGTDAADDLAGTGTEDSADNAPDSDNGAEDGSQDAELTSDQAPMAITIGNVSIVNSAADFADFSLPLPFAANINNLNGSISTISSGSAVASEISMEGTVDEYGLLSVEGTLTPLDINRNTSLAVNFENVDIPKFSAYMIPFAGRTIESGRLDLNLGYSVTDSQLDSVNSLLLRDFALGERVEHEGAMSLPLDLAVALLKNPEGHIDLELPIAGDVNDPQFSFGAVIRQVLSNLIIRVAASPFNLLANLVGFEGEEFDSIAFVPGSAAMTPPQQEKAAKLAEAMTLRPSIVVDVAGVADPEVDAEALLEEQFDALLSARMEQISASAEEEMMLPALRRAALEALYAQQIPAADLPDLPALRAMFTTVVEERTEDADTDSPAPAEEQFDELAYVEELSVRLLALQALPEGRLEALAAARADALMQSMLAAAELAEERINQLDVIVDSVAEEGRILMSVDMGTPR